MSTYSVSDTTAAAAPRPAVTFANLSGSYCVGLAASLVWLAFGLSCLYWPDVGDWSRTESLGIGAIVIAAFILFGTFSADYLGSAGQALRKRAPWLAAFGESQFPLTMPLWACTIRRLALTPDSIASIGITQSGGERKMRIFRVVIAMGVLAAVLTACGPLPSSITINLEDNTEDVRGIVQATLQAMTLQAAPQPAGPTTPEPSSVQSGSISGSLNYPSESLPAMYVTAFEVGSQNYRYVITYEGQQTYQIDGLTPGTYHVVAYTVRSGSFPAGLSGGYTQAVPCGVDYVDDDGFSDDPFKVQVNIRKKGEEIWVNFNGTSRQAKGNINCPWSCSQGGVFYTIVGIVDPYMVVNSGTFRPIHVESEEGLITLR